MSIFEVVLIILTFVSLTNGRVISSPSSRSEADQYQKNEGREIWKKLPVELEFTQRKDSTVRIQQMEMNSNMMRILTSKTPDETQHSKEKIANSRHKRSYDRYKHEFQWPNLVASNTWSTNDIYTVQRPFMLPMEGSAYGKNSKYTYYENVDPQFDGSSRKNSRSSRNILYNELSVSDTLGGEEGVEKPVWDITAYHPNTAQSSRQSRASKRELSLIFEENELSGTANQLSNDISVDNGIQSGPLSLEDLKGPSKCAWAIVSCCAALSEDINHKCFTQLGCVGPFWDVSPCSAEIVKAAVQITMFYYNSPF